jgi:hypothetical protein
MNLIEAYYSKLPINKLLLMILDNRANGNSTNNENYNLLLIHVKERKPNIDQLNVLDLILEEESEKLALNFELLEQKIKFLKAW